MDDEALISEIRAFTPRTRDVFFHTNMKTVGQVRRTCDRDFLKQPRCGYATLLNIRAVTGHYIPADQLYDPEKEYERTKLLIDRACLESADCALGLVSTEVFVFVSAKLRPGGWIHLCGMDPPADNLAAADLPVLYFPPGTYRGSDDSGQASILPKGVDVRRDQIVWITYFT